MVTGGFDEIMQRNNSLALKARDVLCETLGTEPPTPNSMVSAMATIDLLGTYTGTADIMGDPLHNRLLDEWGIQVPVFPWPHHQMRYFRISTYLYNTIEEYEYLANVLKEIL